jgi:hypothetical protein
MDDAFRDFAPYAKLEVRRVPSGIVFTLQGVPLLHNVQVPETLRWSDIKKSARELDLPICAQCNGNRSYRVPDGVINCPACQKG